MTNEEWHRKTEFLLNQQAKFDLGLQELTERQKVTEQKLATVAEKVEQALDAVSQLTDLTTQLITTMTNGFRSAFDRMKRMDEKIDALVNSQIRTDESLRNTNKSLRDTDKRLRDLTETFERYIRNGGSRRNGSEN
jgi:uncharacterized phage infection (PIP) family protein YhgE